MTDAEFRQAWTNQSYKKSPDKIYAQMMGELQQMKSSGVISSGFGQVSGGLSTLSKIPILGNLFTRPAWISSAASNIFKILGFSKPTSQSPACESKLRGQNRMANYNGVDTSHKMALSADNEIETKPGMAGTSADEMDMSHILSIPNFWDRFNWDTTQSTDTILWDNFVTPFKVKNYSATITDRFRCTHMGYVANTHGYWRGSIVYTFKFVKTKFHSGRLRISFIPFYFNTTISTGTPDVSRTQKVIVDLRESTEVSFTIPYVSSRPWMFCIRPEASWLGANNQLMYNAVTGIVRVEVLNQLVAANNVFPSVETLVEVNGGPDLTFAAPCGPSYVPWGGNFTALESAKQEKEHREEYDNRVGVQMMGENEAIARNDAQHGVHPMSIDTHKIDANWSPEAMSIGEKIMSVRQLIKRFGYWNTLGFSSTNMAFCLSPFSVAAPKNSTPGTGSFDISLYSYYYYLYAFYRGSMRLKVDAVSIQKQDTTGAPIVQNLSEGLVFTLINSVQDTFNYLLSLFSPTSNNGFVIIPDPYSGITNVGNSMQIVKSSVEGMSEVELPYYNVSHISPATIYTRNVDSPITMNDVLRGHLPPQLLTVSTNWAASTLGAQGAINARVYRAPGDDFSLMYLVGVPPLTNVGRP